MAYVIIDPCGVYPSELMPLPARQLDQAAVAVFSSPARYMLWRDKWSKSLGQYVVDEYLVSQAPSLDALAAKIGRDWSQLTGIIPWDEESILLGAMLGDRLGLGWNSARVIERCRDKAVMKDWLRRRGRARVNAAAVVTTRDDALEFQAALGRWPVVVKPSGGSGSTDVYFPADRGELLHACQMVMQGGEGDVLIEEYVGGDELAVNGIVDANGDLLVTDVWLYDRRTVNGVPNVYVQTIKVSSTHPVFSPLARYAATVVEDLELRRAPIHMEVKVDDRGPCLIEVGARFSGANLPLVASKLHGRSLFELAACHYLTELPVTTRDVDLPRYDRFEARVVSGVQTVDLQRIRAVHGVEHVRSLPSFDSFGKLRPVGTRCPVTRDVDTISYEVYLIHTDGDRVERDATEVRRALRYE